MKLVSFAGCQFLVRLMGCYAVSHGSQLYIEVTVQCRCPLKWIFIRLLSGLSVKNLSPTGFKLFSQTGEHVRSLITYPFDHKLVTACVKFKAFSVCVFKSSQLKYWLALMILLSYFVMVINITVNKTFSIHDSVKQLFITQCFQQK